MGMTKVYSCDICRVKIKEPNECFGVCFSGTKNFVLDRHYKTDGVHICHSCVRQLKKLLPKIGI